VLTSLGNHQTLSAAIAGGRGAKRIDEGTHCEAMGRARWGGGDRDVAPPEFHSPNSPPHLTRLVTLGTLSPAIRGGEGFLSER